MQLIDLNGRVAIVTGAGGGLGRAHARLLAQRGARVVVNDLGGGAESVTREIVEAGGEARAFVGSVTDAAAMQKMVDETLECWHRIDILVNNAGILRDKTFAKISLDDFRLVVEVHLMGAVHCTKAVWETMRKQNYGRVVMTTLFVRPLRQFWPIQLRSCQAGARWAHADACPGGSEIRYSRELHRADCGHANAGRHSARGAAGAVAA